MSLLRNCPSVISWHMRQPNCYAACLTPQRLRACWERSPTKNCPVDRSLHAFMNPKLGHCTRRTWGERAIVWVCVCVCSRILELVNDRALLYSGSHQCCPRTMVRTWAIAQHRKRCVLRKNSKIIRRVRSMNNGQMTIPGAMVEPGRKYAKLV